MKFVSPRRLWNVCVSVCGIYECTRPDKREITSTTTRRCRYRALIIIVPREINRARRCFISAATSYVNRTSTRLFVQFFHRVGFGCEGGAIEKEQRMKKGKEGEKICDRVWTGRQYERYISSATRAIHGLLPMHQRNGQFLGSAKGCV